MVVQDQGILPYKMPKIPDLKTIHLSKDLKKIHRLDNTYSGLAWLGHDVFNHTRMTRRCWPSCKKAAAKKLRIGRNVRALVKRSRLPCRRDTPNMKMGCGPVRYGVE